MALASDGGQEKLGSDRPSLCRTRNHIAAGVQGTLLSHVRTHLSVVVVFDPPYQAIRSPHPERVRRKVLLRRMGDQSALDFGEPRIGGSIAMSLRAGHSPQNCSGPSRRLLVVFPCG